MRGVRRLVAFWCILLAVVAGGAWAQAPNPVHLDVTVAPTTARPGEFVRVSVRATIDGDYHIYGLQEKSGKPTRLTIEADGLVATGETSEPTPITKYDKGFEKDVLLHENRVTFTQVLQVPATVKAGTTVPLAIAFQYQACNAEGCLNPKTLRPEVAPLPIEAGGVRPEYSRAQSVAAAMPGGVSVQQGSLGAFLAAAFAAGLLALLTPCVFPMIPVTLAFFTKQATREGSHEADHRALVTLAGIYALGIIVAFTAIGVVLALVVGASGAAKFATNPWTNVAFGVLFVVFGLALLEIFDLRLPQSVQAAAGGRRGGIAGVAFMGITFVVSAFTCTAPFVGTVLAAAASGGNLLRPILGMAFFAAALALPFFLLALFPGLLARLPRSGAWLTTIKGVMGFVELVAALKFLSNADLAWRWNLLTRPVFLGLSALVFLATCAWLLGKLQVGYNTPGTDAPPARRIWAGIFAALGIYCLYGLTGRPMDRLVGSFLPPDGYGATATVEDPNALPWLRTMADATVEAARAKPRILVDFTGHTCTNCRDVEKHVFPVPEVRAQLAKFVRTRLYVDGGPFATDAEGAENLALEQKFGGYAQPFYAVVDADGTLVATTDYNTAKDATALAAWLEAQVGP
jgi:thiol:disulfide interchange protein DsbD